LKFRASAERNISLRSAETETRYRVAAIMTYAASECLRRNSGGKEGKKEEEEGNRYSLLVRARYKVSYSSFFFSSLIFSQWLDEAQRNTRVSFLSRPNAPSWNRILSLRASPTGSVYRVPLGCG